MVLYLNITQIKFKILVVNRINIEAKIPVIDYKLYNSAVPAKIFNTQINNLICCHIV